MQENQGKTVIINFCDWGYTTYLKVQLWFHEAKKMESTGLAKSFWKLVKGVQVVG